MDGGWGVNLDGLETSGESERERETVDGCCSNHVQEALGLGVLAKDTTQYEVWQILENSYIGV